MEKQVKNSVNPESDQYNNVIVCDTLPQAILPNIQDIQTWGKRAWLLWLKEMRRNTIQFYLANNWQFQSNNNRHLDIDRVVKKASELVLVQYQPWVSATVEGRSFLPSRFDATSSTLSTSEIFAFDGSSNTWPKTNNSLLFSKNEYWFFSLL